ncbi:hypothetical protein [Lysobacter antibioticus]|uniref:hypothetical protein n=1 Tax=Lysobacter antibioticus TaxID=84531 RepID=UPI0014701F83|nr:hypothetical protein [Lysobacter antibioticus]
MNNGFVRNTCSVRLSGALLPLMHGGIPACSESLIATANALFVQKLDDSVVSASPI